MSANIPQSARWTPTLRSEGPAVIHDLGCWECWQRPAVYDVMARAFLPCWECQGPRYNPVRRHLRLSDMRRDDLPWLVRWAAHVCWWWL